MDVPNIAADPVDRLQRCDARTLVLAVFGGALEFYDCAFSCFSRCRR